MEVKSLSIPDVKLVRGRRFGDDRGFFQEVWRRDQLLEAGLDLVFVQENYSLSRVVGTVRGLHFQTPPKAQAKFVRVLKGSILDVAVDLRTSSPTYGKWVAVTLSASEPEQLLVPIGFGHGFCTLEPETEVGYMVTEHYSAPDDAGILWNDPDLAITWPDIVDEALLSPKDRVAPRLSAFDNPF